MHKLGSLTALSCRGGRQACGISRHAALAGRGARCIHNTHRIWQDETPGSTPPSEHRRRNASVAANDEIQSLATSQSAPDRPPPQLMRRTTASGTGTNTLSSAPKEVRRRGGFNSQTSRGGGARGGSYRGGAAGGSRGGYRGSTGAASTGAEGGTEQDSSRRGYRGGRGGRRSGGEDGEDGEDRPQRGRRGKALAPEDDPKNMDWEDLFDEYHQDEFSSDEERHGYAQVARTTQNLVDLHYEFLESGDDDPKTDTEIDPETGLPEEDPFLPAIKQTLAYMADVDETSIPRHLPVDVEPGPAKGQIGGIPIGQTGMADHTEDNLQAFLANDKVLRDPKNLAKKILAGDIVRFRHSYEKARTEEILTSYVGHLDISKEEKKNTKVKPLTEEAKKLLVQKLVSGRHEDTKETEAKHEELKRAARYTHGQWRSGPRDVFLQTIEELLPVSKSAKS